MFTLNIVNDRLFFAGRRLSELEKLNNGDIAGADTLNRQQLIQEFFFHLVGAIELLAQIVNISKNLGIDIDEVSVGTVRKNLPEESQVGKLLGQLHPPTRGISVPANPYSEDGCHFRIIAFRNYVCHKGHNPFFFRVGSTPRSSLLIDPRNRDLGGSQIPAIDELKHFWKLINDKCQQVLNQL